VQPYQKKALGNSKIGTGVLKNQQEAALRVNTQSTNENSLPPRLRNIEI